MAGESIQVLLIEDNPGDARLIQELLYEVPGLAFSLERVDRLSAGLARLTSPGIDVVVLDLTLPDSAGYGTFQRVYNLYPHTPVVLLTGLNNEELGARAVREGAQDYISKNSLDGGLLARSLRYAVERKRAADALRKSEQLFERMFSSLTDAVLIVDAASGRIINCNPAANRILGYYHNELLGLTTRAVFYPPDNPPEADDCIIGRSGSKSGGLNEALMRRKDGQVFFAEFSAVPLEDEQQQVLNWVLILRDISARKAAEETLRESEERYNLAVQGASDGLWDWNLKKDQIYYSPRWKSMFGYAETQIGDSPNEWLGRIHPEDRDLVQVALAAHLNGTARHFEVEHRVLDSENNYRWVLVRGLAVRDSNGVAYRMAGSLTDVTARKNAEEQLVHDAFHDQLTGLPNRALFMDRLGRTLNHSYRRAHYLFAVLFLDLDRFKIINDSLGHAIGDQLLVETGRILQTCLRAGDTVARLGGDEFVILLEDISDQGDAIRVAKRIQKELSRPFQISQHQVHTSASVGVVLSTIGYTTREDVLRDADIAMYQAKLQGRAQFAMFDTEMRSRAIARLEMETELRHALERQELQIYYQPIISLQNNQLVGFEALLRWQHPERGSIPPAAFIPIAEETSMILPIGTWVLSEACQQVRAWQLAYPSFHKLQVSVNISQLQFNQPDLLRVIKHELVSSTLAPECLNLEITENMLMENAESVVAFLTALRKLGVRLHIDDFGTGYSSLSYLQRFPIDALKIDYSFINRIGVNGDRAEIVKTIITLARDLGIDAVAEGVETKNQLEQLRSLDCGFAQGFYIAEPMPPRLVPGFLESLRESYLREALPAEIDHIQLALLGRAD